MKLLILLLVGAIIYFLTRGYNTQSYKNININKKQKFDGDLYEHEAGLLVALMAKVAKADGQVCELEAEVLKHTFTDISSHFENSDEVREQLKQIYAKEKESFENTIDLASKYLKLTKWDYKKRLKVMEYLLNLAFIDGSFSETEKMITEDIANALEIKRADLEELIGKFETFYQQKQQTQQLSLDKAYGVLGVDSSADMSEIKKAYRKLVKEHHPDIVAGQGASQSIIDEATAKLQEINEAYELIKKDKNG
jgi:DnaJ like chaperone protein